MNPESSASALSFGEPANALLTGNEQEQASQHVGPKVPSTPREEVVTWRVSLSLTIFFVVFLSFPALHQLLGGAEEEKRRFLDLFLEAPTHDSLKRFEDDHQRPVSVWRRQEFARRTKSCYFAPCTKGQPRLLLGETACSSCGRRSIS